MLTAGWATHSRGFLVSKFVKNCLRGKRSHDRCLVRGLVTPVIAGFGFSKCARRVGRSATTRLAGCHGSGFDGICADDPAYADQLPTLHAGFIAKWFFRTIANAT